MCLIETEAIEQLTKEIKDNQSVAEAKNLLEKIEREIQTFKDSTISAKSAKFEKDSKSFNIENVYPFLKEDYYTLVESRRALNWYQGRSKNRFTTFSETSSSESSSDSNSRENNNSRKQVSFLDRGGQQKKRFKPKWEMQTRNRTYRS